MGVGEQDSRRLKPFFLKQGDYAFGFAARIHYPGAAVFGED
jgi:hypothetical protein